MLDEFRSTLITWDKATSRIYSPVTANASDENGRKLVVQIVNGGQVEDLTGATLHLYWETRDKLHDGLDVFKAVDLKKGEFELSYTTGMLSNKGVLNANLVLIDTVGRVVSERFKITVTEGIDDDAIQSENSFSSLTQALIDISDLEQNYAPRLNDLTAQLQQKVSKGNVSVADINKNRGKLDQTYMTDDFLQQIVGEAPVNAVPAENSVTMEKLADKAVTPRKLHGASSTKNMFDKSLVTLNKYPRPSNGIIEDGEYLTWGINAMSDFIEVEEETDYRVTKYSIFCFYDVNKNFISGSPQYTLKSPLGAHYLLLGIKSEDVATQQLEKGTQSTNYEPYGFEVDGLRVSEYEKRLNELKAIKIGKTKNLFNKNTVKLNYYPHLSTGIPTQGAHASGMSAMSEFIEIKPNTDYRGSKYTGFVFYDQNKQFISSVLYYGTKSPSNAKYLRVGIKTIDVDLYQLEEGTDVTYYVEYGNALEDITIPKYEEAFRGLETILETLVEV